jgi:hypothetical protein
VIGEGGPREEEQRKKEEEKKCFDAVAAGGKEDKGAGDKRTEEKGKRDFLRTYARFQKIAGARL